MFICKEYEGHEKYPNAAAALCILLLLDWKLWTIQATTMWTWQFNNFYKNMVQENVEVLHMFVPISYAKKE